MKRHISFADDAIYEIYKGNNGLFQNSRLISINSRGGVNFLIFVQDYDSFIYLFICAFIYSLFNDAVSGLRVQSVKR
jgi:hypothetical protein